MKLSILSRKTHRWLAVIFALPLGIVCMSGTLLQLKKEVAWIQPPTCLGRANRPTISFEQILAAARSQSESGIEDWSDIERLDVRVDRGIVKVHGPNRNEVQVDLDSGEVLQVAFRRSDLIESIHDGSFFHEQAKLWIFLPGGLALLVLWVSGVHLWILPHWLRWRRRASGNQRDAR